jgi:hypothetical protein
MVIPVRESQSSKHLQDFQEVAMLPRPGLSGLSNTGSLYNSRQALLGWAFPENVCQECLNS